MYHNFLLKLSIIGMTALTLGGCQDSPRNFRYRVHQVSDMRIPIPANADHKESEMTLDYRILDVDKDGVRTVALTVSNLKVSMVSMSVQCSFDAATQNDSDPPKQDARQSSQQEKFQQHFVGLLGVSYRARLDQDGKVLELLEVDPKLLEIHKQQGNSVSSMLGGDQVKLLLGRESLQRYAQLAFMNGHANQNFQDEAAMFVPNVQPAAVATRREFTFDHTDEMNDQEAAFYNFTVHGVDAEPVGESSATQRPRPGKGGLSLASIEGDGRLVVSAKNGYAIKLYEKFTAALKYEGAGAARRTGREVKVFQVVEETIESLSDMQSETGDS